MDALGELLEDIQVGAVDDYHNEVNDKELTGLIGWYYVSNEEGVIAYFGKERQALHFRLSLINARLNNIGKVQK